MSKITAETLRAVQELNIVDILSRELELKKAGNLYKARCPFHTERTASFTVSPAKGIYKCFGCGAGGDLIKFYRERDGMNFVESVKHLCELGKIQYEEELGNEQAEKTASRKETLIAVNTRLSSFFTEQYQRSAAQIQALDRGIDDITAAKWGLGFSPTGYNSFVSGSMNELNGSPIPQDLLADAGILGRNEDSSKYYYFRNRMMFPIHNVQGKIVGFSGRALSKAQEPKYLNTPETEIFKKSRELYGLYQAKSSIIKNNCVYLVEGQTDVIAMHRAGLTNTVGSLGTAFTREHARSLRRFSDQAVIIYDGDSAGLKAMFKACEELWSESMFVDVVQLPTGQDPDSFIKKYPVTELVNPIADYIAENRREFINFRISLVSEAVKDRVAVAKILERMVNLCPDATTRTILMKNYVREFGLDQSIPVVRSASPLEDLPLDWHVLRVMLLNMDEYDLLPYFVHDLSVYLEHGFSSDDYKALFEAILSPDATLGSILNNASEQISATANEIISTRFDTFENTVEDIELTFLQFKQLCLENLDVYYRSLKDPTLAQAIKNIQKLKEAVEASIIKIINQK